MCGFCEGMSMHRSISTRNWPYGGQCETILLQEISVGDTMAAYMSERKNRCLGTNCSKNIGQ